MRSWLFVLAAFGLGWVATHTLSSRDKTSVAEVTGTLSRGDARLCAGGPESALAVELLPERVDTSDQGEALGLRVKLTGRFSRRALIRHAVEMVDDRGEALWPARTSEIDVLTRAGETHEAHFSTPRKLADGFYQVRVTAVGTDGEEEASERVSLFLRVRDGRIEPLASDEWFASSRANEGVRP